MKQLVIGNKGEVGKSLQEVLQCDGRDLKPLVGHYDIIHICIPYSNIFIDVVNQYQKLYSPRITVIHSTVPVGTSRKLGAVHSPIHGIHPNLAPAIKTFIKYIGAVNQDDAETVFRLYQKAQIKGLIVKNPETSELSKLGCTTRHGLAIIEQKLFKKMCDNHGADFNEAYTMWNRFYGIGYEELGNPYIRRAIVKDMSGKIGGHCILPNCKHLGGPIADFILTQNEKL